MSWSSGTNTIKEGGEAKNLTLQMLEVPKQSGGTEYFVRKSDVTLGTKSISQNGTYTAASDGKYGFSQVTVNVRGGNGSADSSGKPSTSPNAPKPGGSGSAVVGTDPTTGNDQVVGVDESGNLVTTPVPSSIHIVTPPSKTSYVSGETIDFSGIVVGLRNRDGSTFTDSRYMNGHIPMQELIFPVEVAPEAEGEHVYNTSHAGDHLLTYKATGWLYTREIWKVNDGQAYFALVKIGNWNEPIIVAESESAGLTRYREVELGDESNWSAGQTYKGYNYAAVASVSDTLTYSDRSVFGTFSSVNDALDAIIAYIGSSAGGTSIPVQWKSPYTGEILEGSFEITVTGTSHTTESSSGTSGSGGGGSF